MPKFREDVKDIADLKEGMELEGTVTNVTSTKADGSYAIANVPDGSYTVRVWHPKLKGTEKAVSVAGGAAEADFEIAR